MVRLHCNPIRSIGALPWAVDQMGGPGVNLGMGDRGQGMDESVSPVIFLYGMALVLAVGKACTLFIWQTLPKPRPPLRQEIRAAWQRRKARRLTGSEPLPPTAPPPITPPSNEALTEPRRP